MRTRVNIKGRRRLLALIVCILLALTILDDYQGWRFLLLALGGAWWSSRTWAVALAKHLAIKREMRFGWAQVGDRLEERFTLTNRGILPALWVELVDHSDLPDYHAGMATGVDGLSSFQWRMRGRCTRRGLFTLGPTTVRTADPLGFYAVDIHNPRSVYIMVTPPIVPLPEIEVAAGGRAGEGRPRPNAPERTVSASGVREYAPGDNTRWIHWRTSARRDALHVRLFDSTPSGDWWVILDLDSQVQYGEGSRATAEYGVILAASLADRGLRYGKAVGMMTHGTDLVWLPPREGDGQRWEILRALAPITPAPYPLSQLLSGASRSLSGSTSLVIITPNMDGGWLEGLLPLTWLGAVPTVILLDPASFGGAGDPGPIQAELTRWGVHHYLVAADLLERPEAQPGRRGEWKWRVTPSGRAIAANPRGDTSWRSIS